MPYYESVFLARQDISTTQVESLTEGFTKIIQDNGGTIANTEFWGLRNLAYKIKKNRKAHYVLMNIDAPSQAIHEMERQMGLNEDVLRQLTLKVDELPEGPSKIMQSRAVRDDRPPRRFEGGESRPESNAVKKPAPGNDVSAVKADTKTEDKEVPATGGEE